MSVFLTPELRPFLGGTYFPPADAYGRPGGVHSQEVSIRASSVALLSLRENADLHWIHRLVATAAKEGCMLLQPASRQGT